MNKKDIRVITYVDYGRIVFNIKVIMKKKNLTKSKIARNTGLHHLVVERYIKGESVKYDKEVLAKLCFVLDCELQDIMYYVRPKK